MICASCQERLPLSARTCFNCGAEVAAPAPVTVEEEPPRRLPPPAQVRVTAAAAVLDRPFAAARRVEEIGSGAVLRVLADSFGYYHVELGDGRRGFISHAAVQPAAARDGDARPVAVALPAPVASPAPVVVPTADAPQPIAAATSAIHTEPAFTRSSVALPTAAIGAGIVLGPDEHVRYRAVFHDDPDERKLLVVTNERLALHGCVRDGPLVLALDAVSVARVLDDDETKGVVSIATLGVDAVTVAGLRHPQDVRNAILAACTERRLERLRPAS